VASCLAAPALADIRLPVGQPDNPIEVTAESAYRWTEGAYDVWVLRGNCRIVQGASTAGSRQAVLWIDRNNDMGGGRYKVIAYLDGNVLLDLVRDGSRSRLTDQSWLGRFYSDRGVNVRVAEVSPAPDPKPTIYYTASARRQPRQDSAVRKTQFQGLLQTETPGETTSPGTRRIRMFSRGGVAINAEWRTDPVTKQSVAVISSPVNLVVEGVRDFGTIDVSSDRLVIWTVDILDAGRRGGSFQAEDIPLEIYMEGNIEFRQGQRVIYADRMYYDVKSRRGIVLDAELLTPVPQYEGLLRLKSDVLRQLNESQFLAENTFITSSRMGRPRYRIQTQVAQFEDKQRPVFDPATGLPAVDPETGQPLVDHERLATARNNFVFLGEFPVFYYPYIATDLTKPYYYIRRARLKNDSVFGTQVLTDWDAYQIFGVRDQPEGTDWDISLDVLTDRGFGHGTTFSYCRDEFLGFQGPVAGLFDYWGIRDQGLDNLGRGRRALVPARDYRYRLFWQHRQLLPNDIQLSGEVGWISDRNFNEQYFEREWDELKDETTGLELKQILDNSSWSITADARINKAFTQTEWLPRADHFWLGQELFGNLLTWYEHSSIGYARFRTAGTPTDPNDSPFNFLKWEVSSPGSPLSVDGERFFTRQEIDLPVQLGPIKFVPYALGEFAHWGEDRFGDDLQRLYGQVGIRASMPMWKADPTVESRLFNVHGIAHKIMFDIEFQYADANKDFTDLPLYDPLDDDSIEAFRRRIPMNTFGLPAVPDRFDERFYALRMGMAGWVTAPSPEIAEDLTAFRLGMRHRWQTKRGMPGHRRIIDWVTLDTHAVLFPDEIRDNFGKTIGLVDYDFRWHVGDRLTLASAGAFDFFEDGPRIISVGGFLNRPPRGSLYLGVHLLDGPIDNTILSFSYTYRMSPKWVSAFGTSVDLADDGNIGQNFSVTRIGESFLISAGVTVDHSKDNVGFNLAVEPRFLPKTRLGQAGGARIPPAGAFGLE
jgi:hypothetical protein